MKSKFIIFATMCLLLVLSIQANATDIDNAQTIKVGFYEYDVYYYLDKYNKPAGYYHDLLELMATQLNLSYEYVRVSDNEAIEKLRNKEIDLLFGVGFTVDRKEEFIYSRYYINFDSTGVYTNKNISFGDLNALNGLKLGYIENELSTIKFMEFLTQERIEMESIEVESYERLKELFFTNEVDVIIYSAYAKEFKDYAMVYEFSSGPGYIITSSDHASLMKEIDRFFEANVSTLNNPIVKLFHKYFNEYHKVSRGLIGLIILLISIIMSIIVASWIKTSRYKKTRKTIFKNIMDEKYLLYYQPIINPKRDEVVGFEALIRFKDGDKIISPFFFLPQIERANMMYPLSMWIFKQIIVDYEQIQLLQNFKGRDFYISMNLSFQELTYPTFVPEVLACIKQSNVMPYQICFEIVERQKLHDDKKIKVIISQLRSLGFKIAIDDFGTEYSNFDVLENIEYDILKLDKSLVEHIETSYVKQEIVKTLSRIIQFSDKIMINEGIETMGELEMLKWIVRNNMYIQGYYYSKPLPLEKLQNYLIQKERSERNES